MTESKTKWTMLSNLKKKIHTGTMMRQRKEDGVERSSHQDVTEGVKEKD
jgi:hypothetical protein